MIEQHTGLYTDMYELAMAQAYFQHGQKDITACFDYFFRDLPYGGGYVIFAGLRDVLDWLASMRFSEDDLAYLKTCGFHAPFLDYLKTFRFQGAVHAVREGEVVFPLEPILRVEGALIETQIIETCLLNYLNFQSLIATKAARIRQIAEDRILSDFGLRRAHALGGIQASRAAIIGGFNSTSNVYAAQRYGLQAVGTMAHAYVQSHDDELTAFRAFAQVYPENCILLVDTYNTLKSGLPNAIRVAKEMQEKGHTLRGIRLDSGDLADMSKKARAMLDEAGFQNVKIAVSSQLDESAIQHLLNQDAPIDMFGVGTRLVTGHPDSALEGVYKLCMSNNKPRLKASDTRAKSTLPGIKKLIRYANRIGEFQADAIVLNEEEHVEQIHAPFERNKSWSLSGLNRENLHVKVMQDGKCTEEPQRLNDIAEYAKQRLAQLPDAHKQFDPPQPYTVGISQALMSLRDDLIKQYRGGTQ